MPNSQSAKNARIFEGKQMKEEKKKLPFLNLLPRVYNKVKLFRLHLSYSEERTILLSFESIIPLCDFSNEWNWLAGSHFLGSQHPLYLVRYFTKMKSDQIGLKTISIERSWDILSTLCGWLAHFSSWSFVIVCQSLWYVTFFCHFPA